MKKICRVSLFLLGFFTFVQAKIETTNYNKTFDGMKQYVDQGGAFKGALGTKKFWPEERALKMFLFNASTTNAKKFTILSIHDKEQKKDISYQLKEYPLIQGIKDLDIFDQTIMSAILDTLVDSTNKSTINNRNAFLTALEYYFNPRDEYKKEKTNIFAYLVNTIDLQNVDQAKLKQTLLQAKSLRESDIFKNTTTVLKNLEKKNRAAYNFWKDFVDQSKIDQNKMDNDTTIVGEVEENGEYSEFINSNNSEDFETLEHLIKLQEKKEEQENILNKNTQNQKVSLEPVDKLGCGLQRIKK